MKKIATLFLLIISIGLTGFAAQTWEETSSCPPETPFTFCTVAEGYWSMVQFDENLEQFALMSRRKLDVADTQSGEILVSLTPPSAWMEFTGFPAFSADGALVACPVTDGNILMWDVETGELAGTFPSWRGLVAVFSQDGTLLATQSEPGEVTLWSTETEQPLVSLTELNTYGHVVPLGFSLDDAFVFALGISLQGGSVITGAWNTETGNLIRVFPGIVTPLLAGELLALEPMLSGESADDTATRASRWDGIGGNLVETFTFPSTMWATSVSPTGELLAISLLDGTVSLWDIETQTEIYAFNMQSVISGSTGEAFDEARVDGVSFSPDGTLLATATWMSGPHSRTYVHLWNISDLLGDNN